MGPEDGRVRYPAMTSEAGSDGGEEQKGFFPERRMAPEVRARIEAITGKWTNEMRAAATLRAAQMGSPSLTEYIAELLASDSPSHQAFKNLFEKPPEDSR